MVGMRLLGTTSGVMAAMVSNSLRRMPLMREPWWHVGLAAGGFALGGYLEGVNRRTKKDIEEMLALQGRKTQEARAQEKLQQQ